MAKKTKEELKEQLKSLKEERKAAKEELRGFEKENKLAKGEDHSGDAKHGKKWAKLNQVVSNKEEKIAKVEASLEETKGEKGSGGFRQKYEYPDDITSAEDKKKYRAKMRAAAKRAEKGESEEKPKKGKDAKEGVKKDKKKVKKEKVEEED